MKHCKHLSLPIQSPDHCEDHCEGLAQSKAEPYGGQKEDDGHHGAGEHNSLHGHWETLQGDLVPLDRP